jgi:Flp pilus assembly protein TadG
VSRRRGDDGTALVEFTYLAVLLMVPLAYVLLSAFQVQRASFGVTEAARQAGRAYVRAPDAATGLERARRAGSVALADQGVPADGVDVVDPTGLAPGGRVTVTVRSTVLLPVLGALLPLGLAPRIPVSASHVEVVDAFQAAP